MKKRGHTTQRRGDAPPQHRPMLHLVLGGLLLLFNAGSTVFNQMAIRADGGKMAWSPAISASTTEAFKLAVALVFLVRALATASTDKSGKSSVNMPTDFMFCVKYAVPGLLYALCNVLNYTAVEYLGSTNYQLLNNVKIITTAVVYRAALKRRLKIYQWLALILLFFAMCTLGLGGGSDGGGAAERGSSGGSVEATKLANDWGHAADAGRGLEQARGSHLFLKEASKRKLLREVARGAEGPDMGSASNIFAGTIVMLVVSVLSACAGVYNEILVKGTSASVWWQNVLLYTFTLLICLLSNFVFDGRAGALNGQENNGNREGGTGLFDGFTASLWICILMKAFYGQVVSLVFKYASSSSYT